MNTVAISGRICNDIEIRTTPTGKQVTTISVAVDDKFDREKTNFIRVNVWGAQAGFLENYAKKGTMIGVEGRLEQRSWTKGDTKHSTLEVTANAVEILDWSSAQPREGTVAPIAATATQDYEFDIFAD